MGVERGRRQLGRVFSLGRNYLPLSGPDNACIFHVSKNKVKGSVLFDPRVGRGRKLAHRRVFLCFVCDVFTFRAVSLRTVWIYSTLLEWWDS